MPQLDFIAFLSQVFWLLLLFVFFFMIVNKNILPFFSRILKVREKKIQKSKGVFSKLAEEEVEINRVYDGFVVKTVDKTSFLVFESVTLVKNWVKNIFVQFKKEGFFCDFVFLGGLIKLYLVRTFFMKSFL